MNVKANTMNEMFMENITAITESVNTFQQMEEQTVQNDPALLYARQKEEYEQELQKLQVRVEKQWVKGYLKIFYFSLKEKNHQT